ncbi:MAG: hypothetical protein GX368_01435 [Erysipelotrichaceae bacterium]|nr:hypothetical protein [Erysipelotrichaceae bacterium]
MDLKKIFNEKLLYTSTVLLIMLQPLIDMDYLIYDFLDSFGLPRFSTVIRFIIIPLMIIFCFFIKEKNKKKTFTLGFIYGVVMLIYYVLHVKQSIYLYPILDLTTNFKFNWFQELTYILTLILPYGVIYIIYHLKFDEKTIKLITLVSASTISIPIFLGDLFVFGKSTYFGYTVANFFSWFDGIYLKHHPRELTSKFFFNEGNTIGILMFMLLPLLLYFFTKEEKKQNKILMGILIFIHCLSMQILGTRVATFGAVLIPAIYLVIYLFDSLVMKNQKMQKGILGFLLILTAVFGLILDYTPAVENQRVDAENDLALLHNQAAEEGRNALKDAPLIPGSKEFNDFYIFMFEQYGIKAKYASSIPTMYYIDWYNYKFDPKFWVDVIFLPVYDRVGGRRIQALFTNYKWAILSPKEKILGMGYSTFMNGSIVLEKDFVQQIYTLGYLGMFLTCFIWIFIVLYGGIKVLRNFKKLVNLENMTYAIALLAGLGTAYISGHTLDQFVTTMFMSMLAAILLNRVNENEKA